MKKRNLFLSLICSIVLTVALVTVTIVSIVPKKDNNKPSTPTNPISQVVDIPDNTENDGSAEKPIILYDAESFISYVKANGATLVPVMEEVVDEEGNVTYTQKVDEKGNPVTEGFHFVLANDIDFSGVDFKPLFNKGTAFTGIIDGNGHSLKNILVHATAENLVEDFGYIDTYKQSEVLMFHIGVFGDMQNAKLSNISFDNLSIIVDAEVNQKVADAITIDEKQYSTREITVGSIAGMMDNCEIEADVNANVQATPFTMYSEQANKLSQNDGDAGLGGIAGRLDDCRIVNSNINVKFNTVASTYGTFKVGGVSGLLYNTVVDNTNVNVAVETKYSNPAYIAGVSGQARELVLTNSVVSLTVKETGDRLDTSIIKSIDENLVAKVAGAVGLFYAHDDQKSKIENVVISSDVDIDAIFAGVVYSCDINANEAKTHTEEFHYEFNNVIVESNVNVLEAYGFAKQLYKAAIRVDENAYKLEGSFEYNVKLVGTVKLNSSVNSKFDACWLFANSFVTVNGESVKTFKVYNSETGKYENDIARECIKIIYSDNISVSLGDKVAYTTNAI